eukprot:5841920-Pyramimonas_sp.AAC.1
MSRPGSTTTFLSGVRASEVLMADTPKATSSGVAGAKLKQAVMMAYDMFIGVDGLESGPVPPGQVVMLVRLLPHLSTALTLYDDNLDLASNALRVICRLTLSKEGTNELLAHPCCKSKGLMLSFVGVCDLGRKCGWK